MATPRRGGGATPVRRGAAAAPPMLRKGPSAGFRRPSNAKAVGGTGKATPGSLPANIPTGGKGGN